MKRLAPVPVLIFSLLVCFYGFEEGSALRPQYLNYHPDTGFTPLREQRQIKFRDTFQDLPKSIESFLPERRPAVPVKTYVILKNSSQIQQPRPLLNNEFSNLPTYFPVLPSQSDDEKPEPHHLEKFAVSKPSLPNVDLIDDLDYDSWDNHFQHQSKDDGEQTSLEENTQYATDNEQHLQQKMTRSSTIKIEAGLPAKTDMNSKGRKSPSEKKFGERITTKINKSRGNKKSVKIDKIPKAKPTNGIDKHFRNDQNKTHVSRTRVHDRSKGNQVFETKIIPNKDNNKRSNNDNDISKNYAINNGERINIQRDSLSTKWNPRNKALKSEKAFVPDNFNEGINKNTKRASTAHNDVGDKSEAKLSALKSPTLVNGPVRVSSTKQSRSHKKSLNDFLAPFNTDQFKDIATVPISAPFRPSPEDPRQVRETFSSYSSIDESDIPSISDNIRLHVGTNRLVSSDKRLTSGTSKSTSGKGNFNVHMGSLVKSFQLPSIPASKTKTSQQDPTRFDFEPNNNFDISRETLISHGRVSSSVPRKVPKKKSFNMNKGRGTFARDERTPNNVKRQNNSRRKNVNTLHRNKSDKRFDSSEEDFNSDERENWKESGSAAFPKSSFKCPDKTKDKFYADKELGCMVFHRCYEGRKATFACPTGTMFSDRVQVCVWWFMDGC